MMFHALRECHQEAKSALIIHNHVRNHSVYCAFKFRILLMDHCTIKVLHLWKNAHAFRIRWQHCTPSLHNTARTGSTARAWGSKYPAGLNLIHWGKLAWSCHHAQRSLKCMFVKNAGFGTRVAEVLFAATLRSHSANKRQKRLTPRSGMTRWQALSSEGFFRACANINRAVCFSHFKALVVTGSLLKYTLDVNAIQVVYSQRETAPFCRMSLKSCWFDLFNPMCLSHFQTSPSTLFTCPGKVQDSRRLKNREGISFKAGKDFRGQVIRA